MRSDDGHTALHRRFALALVVALVAACGGDGGSSDPDGGDEVLAGGDTTIFSATSNAFSTPAPNLAGDTLDLHLVGDAAFEDTFVTAPAIVNGGLGPVFNESSCVACHPRDGRGRPPPDDALMGSMLVKASAGNDPVLGPIGAPGFGTQLQHRSVFGVDAEVTVRVSYDETLAAFEDGETFSLRTPTYRIESSYTDLPQGTKVSPRVAPPVFGRGLLEAVPDDAILANADPRDEDGDGISGRANLVWDAIRAGVAVGRFGLKAGNPTLLQQTAGAYVQDMGVTNRVFAIESAAGQPQLDGLDDDPELPDEQLDAATFYVQTLAVPARRDVDDSEVARGKELFREARCAGCHVPRLETGNHTGIAELSNQVIWPYTDLLLHDMGEGLADGRREFEANGREWRTPPLWGVGLSNVVNGHTLLLHDGRARGFLEAILWHGGEAEASREAVRAMVAEDRAALVRFLESL
jgi:CxxC motif-containing protein (DUF1111 family)